MNYKIDMPSLVFPEIVGVLATLVLAFSTVMPGVDDRSKRYFTAFFSSIAISRVIFIFDMLTYMKPEALAYTKYFPLIEYISFFLSPFIFSLYMLYYCIDDFKHSIIYKTVISLWTFFCMLHVTGHFTDLFYYTCPDGSFYRKPTHPLLIIPMIIIVLIDLIVLITNRRK
ncbi:MAG: hypothetical protein K6G03_07230, partial [Lachnospiraceae bacterium]|nr:hypothetical protein [Lachnospiraceae bacterium]